MLEVVYVFDYMIDNEAIEFGSRKKTILMIQKHLPSRHEVCICLHSDLPHL